MQWVNADKKASTESSQDPALVNIEIIAKIQGLYASQG